MITTVKNGFITALLFVVDMWTLMQDTGNQIDWDLIGSAYRRGSFGVRNTTAVTAGAVTIDVAALAYPLPRGSVIDFGAGKTVVLSADSPAGDVLLNVNPAPAIADETTGFAVMAGYQDGGHKIPAGTIMCRVAASRKLVPRAVRPGAEVAECVLLTDAKDDSKTDSLTGYGVTYGGVLYENRMPDAVVATGLIPTAFKTELGSRFVWKVSTDSRST
jgi:hypothetical protein